MRIWFAMDALSACDHAPFPGNLLCKPEAAAGGQILTYALVPGDAWARRLWSFGPSAQLLEPVELRMQLASQVEQMRAGYAKLFGP
jgi:predicted DNA-binding transcriptional regulator YafY